MGSWIFIIHRKDTKNAKFRLLDQFQISNLGDGIDHNYGVYSPAKTGRYSDNIGNNESIIKTTTSIITYKIDALSEN